jgi:DNA-binding NarL/FixJ family response regulator/two-component sensor histidine kinase
MSNNNLTVSELNETMLQILHDERKRISADLHDNVQNKLRLLRDKYLKLHPNFAADVNAVLEEVRHVAYQLIPKNLQKYPLTDYLRIYAVTLQQTYSKQFKVDYQTNVEIAVPKQIEMELFRIVQETFNNVLKHAPNTPAFLMRYLQRDENLVLILQDFGEGFDLDAAFEKGTMGLDSIRTRAQLIGAECFIETRRFEGCKIKISLPIEKLNFSDDEPREIPTSYQNTDTVHRLNPNRIKKILIVDNQKEYSEFLQNLILEKWDDIIVEYRDSTKSAKEYLESIHYNLDVVITDITMPQESGIKLIKYLQARKEAQGIHFMVYSINDSPAYVYQVCKVLKVNAYLCKEDEYQESHPIIEALEKLNELKDSKACDELEELKEWKKSKDFEKSKPKEKLEKLRKIEKLEDFIKEKSSHWTYKIKNIVDCFEKDKLFAFNPNEDSETRKVFKAWRAAEKELFCESSTKASIVKSDDFFEEVKKKLGNEHKGTDAIRKNYERFLKNMGFNSKKEVHHLLLRATEDLDLK